MNEVLIERFSTSNQTLNLELKSGETKTLIVFNEGNTDITYNLNANLKAGANLAVYNVVTSNHDTILNQEITLEEKSANVEVLNVLLVGKSAKLTSNIMINHLEEETTSNFLNYAIAKDEASMVLNNNAKIVKGAKKSVVMQKAKGLTLSASAKIKAMPNLFIDEYDVIANHAAAIGSISKEDLFYLMSRGLEEATASSLIVLGFIKPLLDKIEDQTLKLEINQKFIENL